MASAIFFKEKQIFVSNRRFDMLLLFALDVATATAQSDSEREWIAKFQKFSDESWPGINFDLEAEFSIVPERKLWARVFGDVGRRIFLRELGNNEVTFWQSGAIGDAAFIERTLIESVQADEKGWYPDNENGREAKKHGYG